MTRVILYPTVAEIRAAGGLDVEVVHRLDWPTGAHALVDGVHVRGAWPATQVEAARAEAAAIVNRGLRAAFPWLRS